MLFELSRSSGLPLSVQLHNQIKMLILSGRWKNGRKLPTERELSQRLKISRATVTKVYKVLEQDGYISSQQGRGTFISFAIPADAVAPAYSMVEMASDIWDQVDYCGFTHMEFLKVMWETLQEKRKNQLEELVITFIECNSELLNYNAQHIEEATGYDISPILIQDIRRADPASVQRVRRADLVLTTDFHINEIKNLLEEQRPLVDIFVVPDVETIVEISRFLRGAEVALVCNSATVEEWVQKCILQAGIKDLKITATFSRDMAAVGEFLKGKKYVIVTPLRYKEVHPLCDPDAEVVEFNYRPDQGSIRLIARLVEEIQQQKQEKLQTETPDFVLFDQ